MAGYDFRDRKYSRTPPPSAAANKIAPPPSKKIEPVLRDVSPAGTGVGSAAARPGVPSSGWAVAAAKTCGGGVAVGADWSTATAVLTSTTGDGDGVGGAGGAVAAGGGGVLISGTTVGAAAASDGGCGPPVGVLRTTAPRGVAVTEAGGGGVNVEPAAADASGRGVRVN